MHLIGHIFEADKNMPGKKAKVVLEVANWINKHLRKQYKLMYMKAIHNLPINLTQFGKIKKLGTKLC